MYSLNCKYYKKQFPTLEELILDVITSGMDPNYMIAFNGKSTGEKMIEHIDF